MKHGTFRCKACQIILALSLAATAAWAQGNSPAHANWRAVDNRTASAHRTAKFQRAAGASDSVLIAVVLKLNNPDALNSLITAQHTPGNASYHKWLSSAQSTEQFGPTQTQAQAVADYLTQNGFTHVKIAPNRMLVTAEGTAALAQTAFNTPLGVYSNGSGEQGLLNTDAIQVPAALSQIDRVLGLDTLTRMHTHQSNPVPPPGSWGSGGVWGYYPDEFSIVYNRPSGQTGRNTTVAIVGWGDMTPPINDLQAFESTRGIAAVPTSIPPIPALPGNQNCTDESAEDEWSLDAQAIVGISGGVKQLLLYTSCMTGGGDPGTTAPLAIAINQVVSDNTAKVINMSWGSVECGGIWPDWAYDSFFQLGVIQGQTFSAATGDSGAYPCSNSSVPPGTYGDTNAPSVNYPASSPYVIAIGGTTLSTDSNLHYISESGWPYSGGGVSSFEPIPYWQSQYGLSGAFRQVPDLAFDADWVMSPILQYWYVGNGISTSGGTSLASPLFVGAWAVLESANNNTLGFAPPLIYPASQLGASSPLHDITTGQNGPGDSSSDTGYLAGPGYDNVTGLGSFDITKMLAFIGQTTTYTVTASVTGTGGTISPLGTASVGYGTTKTYTLTPSTGNSIVVPVGGTCGGTLSGNTYITNPITANCTVTPAFTSSATSYTVTASVKSGGSGAISPLGAITVNAGATKTFTLTPGTGSTLSSVGGTCGGTLNGNIYTTQPITADCTVQPQFLPLTYTITASAGANGTISPSGVLTGTVLWGNGETFTITPNAGYSIVTPVGGTCGGTLNGNSYATNPITADCTVTAAFTPSGTSYIVTASAGIGGAISPAGAVTVSSGASKAFTITPIKGYDIVTPVGGTCGGTLSGTGPYTYTTKAVTANCTVMASFTPGTYTVTPSVSGAGGAINPATAVSINGTLTATFTLVPSAGYAVSSVGGTCGGTLSGNTYTTKAITANCTVIAGFTPTYTVTVTAGASGAISPSGTITVNSGANKVFTITPNTGYGVVTPVGGTCGGTLSGNTYTTKAITANCTVIAGFIPTYTVAATAGTNGAISPSGTVTVNSGANKVFTITPNTGYGVVTPVGGTCGGTLTGNAYTTNPITANCTVAPAFVPMTSTVITASAGVNGTISPSGTVTVNYGTAKTFTITPNTGYSIATPVGGTCGGTLNGNTYTVNAITANCTVTATFVPGAWLAAVINYILD